MSTKPSSEETPDLQGAFPRLSDAQIAELDAQGQRRAIQPGEVLFAEGDRDCGFFVVLAGKVASVEGHGTPQERVIAVHGAGLIGAARYYGAALILLAAPALIALIRAERKDPRKQS